MAEPQSQEGKEPSRADELDGERIHRLVAERQSLHRRRSWCLIGMTAFSIMAAQLGWIVLRNLPAHGTSGAVYGVAIVLLLVAVVALYRRAAALKREARLAGPADPASDPDLSRLSDGRQRWKNLEEL